MQNILEYEVILIDSGTGKNSEFIRRFAYRKNISILRTNSNSITQAYNMAIDCSVGEYLLFLDNDSFIFSYTVRILWDIVYKSTLPNIICATQNIEEDENGTIVINGIPNKKFSLKVDASFQNLNGIMELSAPNNQKLIALGTQGINGRVGTKFFKRQFINENNIRFIGGGQLVDSELTFIVDAFMRTEKITFIPQVFYGRLK